VGTSSKQKPRHIKIVLNANNKAKIVTEYDIAMKVIVEIMSDINHNHKHHSIL
jgi:hypothetical protein